MSNKITQPNDKKTNLNNRAPPPSFEQDFERKLPTAKNLFYKKKITPEIQFQLSIFNLNNNYKNINH